MLLARPKINLKYVYVLYVCIIIMVPLGYFSDWEVYCLKFGSLFTGHICLAAFPVHCQQSLFQFFVV